jgi:hypothetical protein
MPAKIQIVPQIDDLGRISVESARRVGRVSRRPSHPFYLKYKPYQIQPFLIAPVLPGETMKNALIQARCVTDPVKNPLIGWWNEYYLFYVKLSDLVTAGTPLWTQLVEMLLKNTPVVNATYKNATANAATYYAADATSPLGIDYLSACLDRIVETYFRDEEEIENVSWNVSPAKQSGLYMAKQAMHNAFQSLVLDTDTPAVEDEELPGADYAGLPAHLSDFATHFAQWKEMVAMQMTEATFDDWLKSFGVSVPREQKEELHIPELLRYVREFSYPSNTVNSATGAVASALSWSVAERADKDRFFSEPGFVVGVTTTRPKVYLSKQIGTVTSYMNDAFSWLPALLQANPYTSLKKFTAANGEGPIKDLLGDYWIDLRDLFMYGEQFTNIAMASADLNIVDLPDDQTSPAEQPLNSSYPLLAGIDGLFVTAGGGVRVDGRTDLTILSRVQDTTP